MRVADVDKILKDLENNPNLDFSMCDACWGEIYTTIDNAPTVEPKLSDKQIVKITDLLEYEWGYEGMREDIEWLLREEINAPTVEQPTGEWSKWIISEIRCPNCLEYFDPEWYSAEELKKCPNCGAKMKGGERE